MANTKSPVILKGLIEVPQSEAALLMEAGYFLAQTGKTKEALEIFNGVASLLPSSEIPIVAVGNVYFAQGNFRHAQKEHERALKRNPNSSLAHAHLGEVLLFQKKFDQAKEALEKAISLEPKGLPAKFAKELLKANDMGIFELERPKPQK